MPAERTRSLKREKEDVDGIKLTWTDPVESAAAPQQIAFAPAVTPGTFIEDPFVESSEPAPSLFPSNLDGSGPKKPGHGKKKADDHIPRPPNAFILFRSSFIKSRHVSTEVETNHSTLSKIIGLTWQNMPHEERQFWHSKAKLAQAEHKRKFPDYAFRPSHVKAKGSTAAEKRKVREVGPKDMKRCAKIAQLLVEGKKGADLQAAVEEFDKSHIPTVVTRFDTPITARSFRRSLSEPAPDTDPSAPAFLRPDPKPTARRLRATSSQPTMSRPSTPKVEEAAISSASSSASSIFSPLSLANLTENADTHPDAMWNDMPPLVLPPVGSVDNSFITNNKDVPSLGFSTFVFHEAPATCIESIDPLNSAPNSSELYGAFHAESTPQCAPGNFTSPLAIDLSFLESWSGSPLSSSPCTPISYSGGPFSPVEAVPTPATPSFDAFNMMAQFDSCGGDVGFDCNQRMESPSEGFKSDDPLVHVPHPHHHYPATKGSFPFYNSDKITISEVANMDVAGFTDMFSQSQPTFTF
jgi:hypothetical protein